MRLLLDESVPVRLRDHLPAHEVSTVVEMGWGGTKNGRLLMLAAGAFDALITADRNMRVPTELTELASCGRRVARKIKQLNGAIAIDRQVGSRVSSLGSPQPCHDQ